MATIRRSDDDEGRRSAAYPMVWGTARRLVFAALVLGLASLACNALTRPAASPAAQKPATVVPRASSTPASPAPSEPVTEASPASTQVAPPATISPLLTHVPGIAATLTAVYSTPGVQETLAAQQTMVAGTQAVLSQQLSGTLLSQCPNPSDPPRADWLNIPVMPQATTGQTVQTLVGSYYCFRAAVSTQEMEAFYKARLAPEWILQSDSGGSLEFIGMSQAGIQLLFLVSGPSAQHDLLVAINVTRPMGMPTLKP